MLLRTATYHYYLLLTTDSLPRAHYCLLLTTHYPLYTTHSSLLTPYYLLLITDYLLLTTYYLLLTTRSEVPPLHGLSCRDELVLWEFNIVSITATHPMEYCVPPCTYHYARTQSHTCTLYHSGTQHSDWVSVVHIALCLHCLPENLRTHTWVRVPVSCYLLLTTTHYYLPTATSYSVLLTTAYYLPPTTCYLVPST